MQNRFWLLNLGLILLAPNLVGCKTRRALPDPAQENTLPALAKPENAQTEPEKPQKPATQTAIQLSAQSDKPVYRRGETVSFTLVARNSGEETQTLTFSSGRTFDLGATPVGSEVEIWRWARDKFFTQAFKNITLKPGDTQTFTATWDQIADNGQLAPRGVYNIVAELPAATRVTAAPINIELAD